MLDVRWRAKVGTLVRAWENHKSSIINSLVIPPSPIIHHPFLIVFSLEKIPIVDLQEPVNAAFGESDVPLGARPGTVGLPPVSTGRPRFAENGDFATDVLGPKVTGTMAGELDP